MNKRKSKFGQGLMAFHIPPLKKAQNQGKCHYTSSVTYFYKCMIWMV